MKPYYRSLRLGMRTAGMLSDGIRLGYGTGFDSGTMLDYVYRNEAHGITPLGVLIDRVMLDHPVWRGVRGRRSILVRQLRNLLAARPDAALFDTAAGPGSYLFELPRGDLWAGDVNLAEVEAGQGRARRDGRADIRFVEADAFDPTSWPRERFDILVSSGFFDILNDTKDVVRLLEAGSAATEPGTHWVFTVMEHHPDLLLLRDVLVDLDGNPWVAVTRSAKDVLALAEPFGWRPVLVEREEQGFFGVATMVRV